MPSGDASRVERLRAAVAARVQASSLRGTARAIGMSAPGLQSFLDGTTPHPSTVRKLEAWFVRESVLDHAETDTESASSAIHLLIRDLPAERQPEAALRTLEHFELLYNRQGLPFPAWIRSLREEFGRGR